MAKRALCVGINDYPLEDMDLNGCVNDAHDWAELLTKQYDFPSTDITLLLDAEATKSAILEHLDQLLAGASRGDTLVFTNSSHGTYVADTDGDETTYDEAICPYDTKDNLITDDELRERFAGLKRGVRLTVISDSCFSGSVTRAAALAPTPDDRRWRFVNPRLLGLREIPLRGATPRPKKVQQSQMNEVLLSGCSDKQFSADALINGRYNGAMTATAISVLQRTGYGITYNALVTELTKELKASHYEQEPQLEGRVGNRRRTVFS